MIDAVVTGTSLPALQTALDLAEVGLSVAVLCENEHAPAEAWADRDPDGVIAGFMRRIAEPIEQAAGQRNDAAMPRTIAPETIAVRAAGAWQTTSTPAVFGVPAVPLSSESIAILGNGGAIRAYLDRIRPLLTVGKTRFYGTLVRARVGAKTLERLVEPQMRERFGASADDVEVTIVAPGLNEALARHGALTSAVLAYAERNVARETQVTPQGTAQDFFDATLARLRNYGVQMLEGELTSYESNGSEWQITTSLGETIEARALITDFAHNPIAAAPLEALVGAVAPSEARLYAEIDMNADQAPAQQLAGIALLGDWSLRSGAIPSHSRTSAAEAGQLAAVLSSSVSDVTVLADDLAELQRQGKVSAAKVQDSEGLLAGAVLRGAGLRAAPYRSTEDRDAALAVLAELSEAQPTLLPVGRAVHGDDQAAALQLAHEAAVHLRRRLLGLEE